MAIEITARHMDNVDDLKAYAEEKAKALMEAFPRSEFVHVILDHEKHLFKAEVVLQAGHHTRIEAMDELDSMRAAIDGAFEKAERQYRRQHDRVKDHHPAMKEVEAMRERSLGA